MDDCLVEVKTAYQKQLMLLKELELDRIDLQAAVQWLSSARRNWRMRHAACKLRPSAAIDAKLAQEEQAAIAEVRAADTRMARVAAEVAHLRDVRDGLERCRMDLRRKHHLHGRLVDAFEPDKSGSSKVLSDRCQYSAVER